MLTSHLSGEEKTPSEDDGQVLVTMNTDGQQPPRCAPWNDTLTKKQLTRSMAIERTDSSGGRYHAYLHWYETKIKT